MPVDYGGVFSWKFQGYIEQLFNEKQVLQKLVEFYKLIGKEDQIRDLLVSKNLVLPRTS